MSSKSIVKSPTFLPASSSARLMPLTILSVCFLALPVRGRLETILMRPEVSALVEAVEAEGLSAAGPPQPTSAAKIAANANKVIGHEIDLDRVRIVIRKRCAAGKQNCFPGG